MNVRFKFLIVKGSKYLLSLTGRVVEFNSCSQQCDSIWIQKTQNKNNSLDAVWECKTWIWFVRCNMGLWGAMQICKTKQIFMRCNIFIRYNLLSKRILIMPYLHSQGVIYIHKVRYKIIQHNTMIPTMQYEFIKYISI